MCPFGENDPNEIESSARPEATNHENVDEKFYDLESSFEGSEAYESALEELVCNNSD